MNFKLLLFVLISSMDAVSQVDMENMRHTNYSLKGNLLPCSVVGTTIFSSQVGNSKEKSRIDKILTN